VNGRAPIFLFDAEQREKKKRGVGHESEEGEQKKKRGRQYLSKREGGRGVAGGGGRKGC